MRSTLTHLDERMWSELLDTTRKVTQLEVLHLALGYKKWPGLVKTIESSCDKGGGIDSKTIMRYERRLNYMFDLFERALCKYFHVASIVFLGLGHRSRRRWLGVDDRREADRRNVAQTKMLRSMSMAGIFGAQGG